LSFDDLRWNQISDNCSIARHESAGSPSDQSEHCPGRKEEATKRGSNSGTNRSVIWRKCDDGEKPAKSERAFVDHLKGVGKTELDAVCSAECYGAVLLQMSAERDSADAD
jgi:hypothetical protein